jgi:hypothetical protein
MNDCEERLQKWCHDDLVEADWYTNAIKKNKIETLKIVGWVCTLYLNVSLSLENALENNPRKEAIKKFMLMDLNSYLESVLKNSQSLEDVKNSMRKSSNMVSLFKISSRFIGPYISEQFKDSTKLINDVDKDSKKFNIDAFLSIKLNLSSTHDYYVAKKTLMKYFEKNKLNTDNVDEEMLSKIINENTKYKFDLKSQDEQALQKLISDITTEMSDYNAIHNNRRISKIIHAIRIASTSSGTKPARGKQLDFWNLSDQLTKKAKKNKYSSVFGTGGLGDLYGGAGNIKKGLAYIKEKVSTLEDPTELYDFVVKKVKNDNQVDSDVAKFLLDKIQTATEDLNKKEKKNARSIALLSMINGYQDLRGKLSLDNSSDKMVELLILQELLTLTQKLTKTEEEKNIELLYRSCIDLMSTMVVLQLEGKNNQAKLINDKDVIFPKVISKTELEKNSSNVLVENGGRKALNAGLKCLDKLTFSDNNPASGFRLKTVLSQDKGEEEEKKDIAVYFEIGKVRGEAKEVNEKDDVACVGRITETVFDINKDDINQLNKDVIAWCKNVSDQPKTLCVDLTITKQNDELVAWMLSADIKKLIDEKKLDILVWQSEQKQQSLGTGKFSAGSIYLLSGNEEKIKKFNEKASEINQDAPDNNLSTFFRHYCADAMHDVVKQQTESAKLIADQLNTRLEKCYDAKAVANGSFVTILATGEELRSNLKLLLEEIWPESYSFGFSQTTITSWDKSSIRISVGLESQKELQQEASKIMEKLVESVSSINQQKTFN